MGRGLPLCSELLNQATESCPLVQFLQPNPIQSNPSNDPSQSENFGPMTHSNPRPNRTAYNQQPTFGMVLRIKSSRYGRPIYVSSLYKFRLPKFNMPAAPLNSEATKQSKARFKECEHTSDIITGHRRYVATHICPTGKKKNKNGTNIQSQQHCKLRQINLIKQSSKLICVHSWIGLESCTGRNFSARPDPAKFRPGPAR